MTTNSGRGKGANEGPALQENVSSRFFLDDIHNFSSKITEILTF